MSRSVLKSGRQQMSAVVRGTMDAFNTADHVPQTSETSELDYLKAEQQTLRQALLDAEIEKQQLSTQFASKLEEAAIQNFEAGKASTKRDFEGAEQALQETLKNLSNSIEAALSESESLASNIAARALAQMRGPSTEKSKLIEAMIAHQVEILRSDLIAEICVSSEDFPELSNSQLMRMPNPAQVDVRADLKLSSGEALLRLSIGEVELSLDKFIDELTEVLRTRTENVTS